MSNPAVITLVDSGSRRGKFKRFVIEDNIGESIHLHIDKMRIDFTINEFLEFSSMIRESLVDLDILKGYSINNFGEHFIKECAPFLPQLKEIKIEEIELSNLKCVVNSNYRGGLNLIKLASITNSPAYNYLKGETEEILKYEHYNYILPYNETTLKKMQASINENGYPYNEKYIVLFEGQDIIRDGQDRAAVLAHLYGMDHKIKVMRFYFKDSKHKVRIFGTNFNTSLDWFMRKVYRELKRFLKE